MAGDWFELDLPAAEAGHFQAIVVSMGEMVVGNLAVEVEGAAGGELVDFLFDPCLRDGRPRALKPGTGCSIALGNRLRLAAGRPGMRVPFAFSTNMTDINANWR